MNGEEDPSIATPVSQFFAYTHQAEPFQTERIGVTRKNYPSGAGSYDRGAYRYIDIPFGHEIRVDLDVGEASHINVWSVVYYQETPVPQHYGVRNYLKGTYFGETGIAPYSSVELLNVQGRGSLESMVFSGTSPDGHQVLEGNLKIYVDGESTPSVYVSGTEDLTGNAFYFGYDQLVGGKQGATVHDPGSPTKWTQFRFFDPDHIDFETSLRVVWEAGHKGQSAPLITPVDVQASHFYYLDTQPEPVLDPLLELVVDERFDSYGEGQEIGPPWVQWGGASKWTQSKNAASFGDVSGRDAWMYRSDTNQWPDQVVEADVKINNFGTGEVWLFARGTTVPGFADRVTFGFSAVGAEPEHPKYQPVMLFIASGQYADSSLLLIPANQVHTLRLVVDGSIVTASLKRQGDSDFRELFRIVQSDRPDGYSGVSVVTGDVSIESFRVYRRP